MSENRLLPQSLSSPADAADSPVSQTSIQPCPALQRPLFPLGMLLSTPGALDLLEKLNISPSTLLLRHVLGDWGDLDNEDRHTNNCSIQNGARIFSSYALRSADGATHKVWLITEGDRSVTTFLLPSEY